MSETAIYISVFSTAVAAFAALWAALGAWRSANATKKTAEAALYSGFLTEYSSEEMLKALRVLIDWKERHGDGFDVKWISALKDKSSEYHQWAYEVDIARRKVKYYFFKALMLRRRDYVEKQFLRDIGDLSGINIVYDIVEPLERALNPAFIKAKEFQDLRKICPRIDVEVHHVPPT